MAVLQEYKCPCCDGAIAFDSAAQKMKCPYCDTEFEVSTLQSYDEVLKEETPDNMHWDASAGGQWQQGEADVCGCTSASPAAVRSWETKIPVPLPVPTAAIPW